MDRHRDEIDVDNSILKDGREHRSKEVSLSASTSSLNGPVSSSDEVRRQQLLGRFCLVMVVCGFSAAVTNYLQHQAAVATVFLVCGGMASVIPWLSRRGFSLLVTGNLFAALTYLCLSGANLLTGGFGLPAHFAMGLVPMVAIVIAGPQSGKAWLAACLIEVAIITWLNASGFTFPARPGRSNSPWMLKKKMKDASSCMQGSEIRASAFPVTNWNSFLIRSGRRMDPPLGDMAAQASDSPSVNGYPA